MSKVIENFNDFSFHFYILWLVWKLPATIEKNSYLLIAFPALKEDYASSFWILIGYWTYIFTLIRFRKYFRFGFAPVSHDKFAD